MAKDNKPGDTPKKDDKPAKKEQQPRRGPPRLKPHRQSSACKITGTT